MEYTIYMQGESLENFIQKNKASKIEEALFYLNYLRKFSEEEVKYNANEYLRVLTLFLELIHDENTYNKISLEDVGTTEEEIKIFEEQTLLIEE